MKGGLLTSFSVKPGSMNWKKLGTFFWDISAGGILNPVAMHLIPYGYKSRDIEYCT